MTALLEDPTVTVDAAPVAVAASPRRFRPDVEGLRAVAVGLVVLFHAGITWLPGGYIGVDVFFVISGFLITGLLLREFESEGKIGLTNFYARRARRILPLASVVLIVTVGASSVLLTTIRMASIPVDGVWSSVFAANFRFADSGANYLNATAPPSPLQHFWSLAVEEQFYVVWPALLWCALHFSRRSGGRARVAIISTLAVAASLFWCIHQTGYDANTAYFSPFTRAWELGIGALVAVCGPWLMRLPRLAAAALGWTGLGLIIYGAVRFDSRTAFPGSAALVPVLGAAFVIAGGLLLARGGPEHVLGLKPMQLLGKYSFSLYLWHWPILIIAEGHIQHLNVLDKLGLVALAGLLSAVTFYRLENLIRRMPRLVKSPWASLTVGLVAISASLIYSGMYVTGNRYVDARTQAQFAAAKKVTAGSSAPIVTPSEVLAAVQTATLPEVVPATLTPPLAIAARDRSSAYSNGCLVNPTTVMSPTCEFGSTSPSAPLVVLFGDSHAEQWSPALDTLATRTNFRYRLLTKDSCPASTVRTYDSLLNRNYPECATWRTWALGQIKKLQPDAVIVSEHIQALARGTGRTGSVETAWQSGLRTTLSQLKADAGRVVMLSDTPAHRYPTPDCLAQHPKDALACADSPKTAILTAHQLADERTAKAVGVSYLDVTPWFCTARLCPAVINNVVATIDGSHITATLADYLSNSLGLAVGILSDNSAQSSAATIKQAVLKATLPGTRWAALLPPANIAPKDISPSYTDGCLVEALKTTSPPCTYPGPTASAKRVVIFGDSHAAQWVPALQDSASRAKFSLTVLTKGNCPAPTMTAYSLQYNRAFTECDTWRAWALAKIAELKPSVVIMSSTFHGVALAKGATQTPAVEAAWEAGLRTTIQALQATGARVVDVGDVANHDGSVPECLLMHPVSPLSCATPAVMATLGPHQALETATVKQLGATYIDTRPWFCTATLCPAVVNGIITDFDDSHMTATYSTYLGRAFGVAVGLERP